MDFMEIALFVANRDHSVAELQKWLAAVEADIYVFPEGFVQSSSGLAQIQESILAMRKTVVLGAVEQTPEGSCENALFFEKGVHIGTYSKTSLTKQERDKGRVPGGEIRCMDLLGVKVGVPICYEIHFPKITRIMALDNPSVLFNPIGSGMKDEHQLMEWLAIAKARAIENQVYVMGCSNYRGPLPIAYAISPLGDVLAFLREENGYIKVKLPKRITPHYAYMDDRIPALYHRLADSHG